MRQFYLFAYDIACSKRQARVRRILQGYATGSQKSCYECWITPDERAQICEKIHHIIDLGDTVHSFRLPENAENVLFGCAQALRYDFFIVA